MGETAGPNERSRAAISPPTATTSPVPPTSTPWLSSGQPSSTSTTFTDHQQSNRWRILRHHSNWARLRPHLLHPPLLQRTTQQRTGVMTALSRDFPSPPPLHWPTGSKCGNTRVCCTGGSRRGRHLQDPASRPEDPGPPDVQHFHQRTAEKHHGRLKTLLQILEVAWWPSIRSDIWAFVRDCKSCGVEAKKCAVINPSNKPPHHPPHPLHQHQSHHPPKDPQTGYEETPGGWRTSKAGCNLVPGRSGATYPRTPRLVLDSISL